MALSDNYLRIPLEQIHVKRAERQRRVIDISNILPSIRDRGVVQPIVVQRSSYSEGGFLLITGERRLTASRELNLPDIPARLADSLSDVERQIIELDENVKRLDLPWQDEALAYFRIHNLYYQLDPTWTQAKTADSIGISPMMISMFLQVAEEIEKKNPRVLACTGARAAYNIIARRTDRAVADVMNDLMAGASNDSSPRSTSIPDTSINSPVGIISANSVKNDQVSLKGDDLPILPLNFHQFAQTYTGPPFNFIHCDFPYGINHQDSDQGGSARWGGYSDTDEDYWQLCTTLCQYLDYLFTPSAHLMFWCSSDIERQYETIQFFKQNAPSLEFQTVPLYWHKTDNRGIIPDPKRAPRRIVETALIASRGDRLITRAVSNAYGSPTTKEIHQSEKPEPMLRHFFQMFVDENTRMLDPTCGSATSIRAVESLGGQGLGLEIDGEIVEAARSSLRRARLLRKHQEKVA